MPEVAVSDLRPICDPAGFSFKTTAEVEPYIGLIGQERAVEAIKFGLSIESLGFNICISGEPGTGRTTAVREYLEQYSRGKPAPDEWCYVNNFADPHRPRALCFPAGGGRVFKAAMAAVVAEAKERIPHTFQSDDFIKRRDQIFGSVQRHRETVFSQLADRARAAGFLLQGSATGYFLVPLIDGQPMEDQAFGALPPAQRDEILRHRDELMEELRNVTKEEHGFEAMADKQLTDLQQTLAVTLVDTLLNGLQKQYGESAHIAQYLAEVRAEMIDHIDDFLPRPSEAALPGMPPGVSGREIMSPLRKYEVNLLVDCANEVCAAVVFESSPTPQRLLGRIEKEAIFGAVVSDFTMIRAGSLHQANGGYLVLDMDQIILNPLSWNELKRAIRTGQLTIEEMGERLGYIETKTVRPEPIPWTGKLILIAREPVYRALYAGDPDFQELFKVKADFDMHIDRTPEHEMEYVGLIASVTRKEKLPPLDREAVARIIEEGVRLAEDHSKLSIRFGELTDIVREAAHWARQDGEEVIGRKQILRAIREREERVNLSEQHLHEAVAKGILLLQTEGSAIGQVNGLSVVDLGDTVFGQPARITATVGIGGEGVIDLQRESQLSGPIFSKAVLTLTGFLTDRYAGDAPLNLAARLSFEQSYGGIEGDSATCAETCALLSRLAEVPVKQSYAITGSMDQRGEVQAIGGVNEKIEGFFDVCKERGLTGDQGVIIPASNVQHLMLREDVVQAVKDGKFRIFDVGKVDEALELLTGVAAGERAADGTYPAESLNGRIVARLRYYGERLREAGDGHHLRARAMDRA